MILYCITLYFSHGDFKQKCCQIVEGHCILGFQVGDAAWGTIQDSHLLFAGDTILF